MDEVRAVRAVLAAFIVFVVLLFATIGAGMYQSVYHAELRDKTETAQFDRCLSVPHTIQECKGLLSRPMEDNK